MLALLSETEGTFLIIAVVVLFLVALIKKVIKIAIGILFVGLLVFGFLYFSGDSILDNESAQASLTEEQLSGVRTEAMKKLVGAGAISATYSEDRKGYFVLESVGVKLKGNMKEDTYQLAYLGSSIDIKATPEIVAFINEVKLKQGAE